VLPGKKTTVGISKNRMPASAGILFFQMPSGFSHSIMVRVQMHYEKMSWSLQVLAKFICIALTM
jgi:hypothetical protein